MIQNQSIFFEEWRACLREHYLHVVRNNDAITEPTLRTVLLETGFTEDEINKLYEIGLEQREALQENPS
jgi:hypothetical protein